MDVSPEQIRWALLYVLILLISVALHEFGHAFMADRLGDDTPRRQGRVTLNPLAHADLIGTIVLPLMGGFVGGGFGWGKPVQWQPHRVSRRISMATAKILVSVAGPAMNLVLGTAIALVHTILVSQHVISGASGGAGEILWVASRTNYLLFFFNLLPVPPLDGGHVAQSFLPYRYRNQYAEVGRYAPYVLLPLLLVVPQIGIVFVWPATQVRDLVYHGFGHLFGLA
jgi:Zn-dependent protease